MDEEYDKAFNAWARSFFATAPPGHPMFVAAAFAAGRAAELKEITAEIERRAGEQRDARTTLVPLLKWLRARGESAGKETTGKESS